MTGLAIAANAHAVEQIQIRIGQITHPAGQVEDVAAVLKPDGSWRGQAKLKRADLAAWPKEIPLPVVFSRGSASGTALFSGQLKQIRQLEAQLDVRDAAFSDVAGLHAGENIDAGLNGSASLVDGRWQWQASAEWRNGEVFWQPLYFSSGGHRLEARGTWSPDKLVVDRGTATLKDIGQVAFSAEVGWPKRSLEALTLTGRGLKVEQGYALLAKPFLEKTVLGNLEAGGAVDVEAHLEAGRLDAFHLLLHDVDLEDKNGRFAFYKLNADVPWSVTSATVARAGFSGGRVLQLPLGQADLSARLEGWSLTAQEWKLPVLDGAFVLQDISAALRDGKWAGHLAAHIQPIAMGEFAHALGWPRMEGTLGASIPLVTYSNGLLAMDGTMKFDVFDGEVAIGNLSLRDPLGLAPRLNADVRMRNLDLDLLTRTYAFGAMSGRLDGDVNGLELSSWKPVKFDAGFRSSPGRYPRKISQRAVENISALGGAGAAAAIQRSFLRFFKEFNYDRIGLSCRLRNGVCAMDGVEPAQGGYVIVKGSGIPAITVLGYNHSVSWDELLSRLQRVTQGNRPVIK
jgi:hypothetical protein